MLRISSERLQAEMMTRGLTITELASKASVSTSTLSRFLKADTPANYRTFFKLATALNVPAGFLIGTETKGE